MSLTRTTTGPSTSLSGDPAKVNLAVDGHTIAATEGELLVEAILREREIPHICYHSPLMGPIQTVVNRQVTFPTRQFWKRAIALYVANRNPYVVSGKYIPLIGV